MKEAHKNMNITEAQYDATIGHLVATLKELNVDAKILAQIAKLIEPLRNEIISPKPPTTEST